MVNLTVVVEYSMVMAVQVLVRGVKERTDVSLLVENASSGVFLAM
jgi:hypothetical protein